MELEHGAGQSTPEKKVRQGQSPEQRLSRGEVTGGMGLILSGLLDTIHLKALEVGAADNPDVLQAMDELEQKALIIGYGIRKRPRQKKLNDFYSQLKLNYESSVAAIQTYGNDRYRLVDMAVKIGITLHQNATVKGIITEKAQRQLEELED